MKQKIKIYLFLILISSGFWINLNAQVAPTVDENWELDRSDEFNGTTLDNTKWDALDPWNGIGYNWGDGQYFRPANVSLDGSNLQLKVEDIPGHDKYYSGGIRSVDDNYSYGYFEIRAIFPGFYNNGEPCGEGFWPAFWTYYTEEDANGCRTVHDEIDIMDPGGLAYADANIMVSCWNDEHPDCDIDFVHAGTAEYYHDQPLFVDYHKYAAEWLPDRIIFYFDDQPFHVTYNDPTLIMQPQYVVIDQQIDGNLPIPYLNPNTPLPHYMSVDYFRYYTLKEDCNNDALITNNNQLNSFNFAVKRNITIGNGSSTISLSSNDNMTFRATDNLIINGEFTVPLGSELNLIPTPCN